MTGSGPKSVPEEMLIVPSAPMVACGSALLYAFAHATCCEDVAAFHWAKALVSAWLPPSSDSSGGMIRSGPVIGCLTPAHFSGEIGPSFCSDCAQLWVIALLPHVPVL